MISYDAAIAGMVLEGCLGSMVLTTLIFGWRDLEGWFNRLLLCVISAFCLTGFGYCWNAKIVALERKGVVSSCIEIKKGEDIFYQLTDSTLQCNLYKDYPERYVILKKTRTIIPDDQSKCLNCGKTMRYHVDDALCKKTYKEMQADRMIDYLTDPL